MSRLSFLYSLVSNGESATVTAWNPDATQPPLYTASIAHPMWDEILVGLKAGDPNVWDLFDVEKAAAKKFSQVSERIFFGDGKIFFDGDEVHSALAAHLIRTIKAGGTEGVAAIANFWEKLESNPNEHSKQQAYAWLSAHQFQITQEGDIVGHKGVERRDDATYASTTSSREEGKPSAYVNGEPLAERSFVLQEIGDVVSMPRSEVEHNPKKSCSRGLHVGTFDYASTYGDIVLEVHVNPRDIVSVPDDASGKKVRVCRYKVVNISRGEGTSPVLSLDKPVTNWVPEVGYRG